MDDRNNNTSPSRKTPLIKIVLTVLGSLLFLFLAFIAYGVAVNNSFYKLILVTSDSMTPVFKSGDLIMIVRVDPDQVKVGDIVTFQTKDHKLLTHRIVEIKEDGEIVTKGDANEEADRWSDGWKLKKVSAKYVARIPIVGRFMSWIKGSFVNETVAWLKDTKKLQIEMVAGVRNIPDEDINKVPDEPTATPEPTETSEPTMTPEPTPIPAPTAIPEPTETPEPTMTPEPTATPEQTEVVEASLY